MGVKSSLQNPFGTGNGISPTRVNLDRHAHGSGKGFKGGFDNVMGINTVKLADVESHLTVVHYGHKKLPHQLGIVGAYRSVGICRP